jgi:hypothetical protein
MKVLEVPLKVHERYCGVRQKAFMTKTGQNKGKRKQLLV